MANPPETVFSLAGKGLKLDKREDVIPLVAKLRESDGDIREVRLQGNSFGVEACEYIGSIISTLRPLNTLDLSDMFTGRLVDEIPAALEKLLGAVVNMPNLRTVALNDNAFGLNTQAPLVDFLSKHVPLQHLYLNNNGLGPHAGILIADALSALHARKEEARGKNPDGAADIPDLETIVCGRNRLENGSMTAWARTFQLHKNVRTVKMVQNGIRQDGIHHLLSEGLHHATALRVLDLQDNTFTLTGARALAAAVPRWSELEELGIGDSLLSNKGSALLADALRRGKTPKLQILRLQYNDITSPGLRALAQAADTALPALQKLELNGNKFAEDDPSVVELQSLFEKRKEARAGDVVDEEAWGLDSLSDLEDDDSDEDEDEDDEDEGSASDSDKDATTKEERAEKLIKEAEEAQEEPVTQKKDKAVDSLADTLENTKLGP